MTVSATVGVGTPEYVMEEARRGRLPKQALVQFLATEKRQEFLDACTAIERRITAACTTSGNPCLESGCSLEGEVCLEPVLGAGLDYYKACGEAFTRLFAVPENRSSSW